MGCLDPLAGAVVALKQQLRDRTMNACLLCVRAPQHMLHHNDATNGTRVLFLWRIPCVLPCNCRFYYSMVLLWQFSYGSCHIYLQQLLTLLLHVMHFILSCGSATSRHSSRGPLQVQMVWLNHEQGCPVFVTTHRMLQSGKPPHVYLARQVCHHPQASEWRSEERFCSHLPPHLMDFTASATVTVSPCHLLNLLPWPVSPSTPRAIL